MTAEQAFEKLSERGERATLVDGSYFYEDADGTFKGYATTVENAGNGAVYVAKYDYSDTCKMWQFQGGYLINANLLAAANAVS